MKKILFLLLPLYCFGQRQTLYYKDFIKCDSLKVGDSILTQATFLRIGTGGGSGSVNSGGATNITGIIKGNGSTLSAAVAGTDYATASGTHYEQPVKYATTAALPASTYNNGTSGVGATLIENANGALSVDGASPTTGDRILVKNEATTANNGIYSVTSAGGAGSTFTLTRVTDWDQSAEVQEGDAVFVLAGSANLNTSWYQQTAGTITMGSSAIVMVQFNVSSGLPDPGANGVVVRTASNTTTNRTITGTTNKLAVTNGDGVSGNPTLNVGTDIVDKTATNTYAADTKQNFATGATNAGFRDIGATADPGSPADGDIWYRSDLDIYKYRQNGNSRIFANTDETQTLTNKTLSLNNTTLTGTIAQFNTAVTDADFATLAGTETLSGKRINKRILSASSNSTPTPDYDNYDMSEYTALAVAAAFQNPTGTPVDGQEYWIVIKDNGTARALSWGTAYNASTDLPLPITTSVGKIIVMKFFYSTINSKLNLLAVLDNL